MARTFRRLKNKKGSHNHSSGKFHFYDYRKNEHGFYSYILLEGKEYKKAWHCFHGENGKNEYTPSRTYRKMRENELRSVNKTELIKFVKRNEYEPICRENPKSHYWDWS